MGKSLVRKILSILAVGIVIAHLSPAAAAVLLCLGDGADSGCCPEPSPSQSRAVGTEQLRDGSDCRCCITVDAAASAAGAPSLKASVEILFGSGIPRDVVSPPSDSSARLDCHGAGPPRLSSLRTVVLLI